MFEVIALVCALSGPPSCTVIGWPVDDCTSGVKQLMDAAAKHPEVTIRRAVCGTRIIIDFDKDQAL